MHFDAATMSDPARAEPITYVTMIRTARPRNRRALRMGRARIAEILAKFLGPSMISLLCSLPVAGLELMVVCHESPMPSAVVVLTDVSVDPALSRAPIVVPLNELRQVDLGPGRSGPWSIRAEADSCWGPPSVWAGEPEMASDTVVLELEAAGKLDFGIKAEKIPQDLVVSFMHPGADSDAVERFEQTCTVTRGRGLCVVPARRLDVRLVAEGYAPVFLWDLEIVPGESLRLGDIELKQGASISGWVAVVGNADPRAEVSIWSQRVAEPRSQQEEQRLALTQSTVSTDERGHFVIPSLQVGGYALSARREGFASSVVEAEIDEAGQSVALDETLTLVPRSQLSVDLDPPLDPWGQPWHLRMTRETDETNIFENVAKGVAADRGTWTSPRMDPGQYFLSIVDSQGGTWKSQEISLLGGAESLFWSLDTVPVRGHVTLGGEPLKAEILFGSGSSAITFESEEDGTFRGHLPKEGIWPVRVEMLREARKARLAVDPVVIRRRSGKSYAEVELALPNTVLEGKVTKDGRPAKALVVALRREPPRRDGQDSSTKRASELSVWSDEEGVFEVLGLSPGPIEIRASDRFAESGWSSVVLVENETALVDLELTERLTVRGRVVAADGPVVGARVLVLVDGTGPASAATDVSGEFRLKLPSHVRTATVVVDPGSRGGIMLFPLRVGAEGGDDLLISLPRGQGQLTMKIDPGLHRSHAVRSLADLVPEGALFYNGAGISVRQVLSLFPPSGNLFDGAVPLPPLAEGQWLFCPRTANEGKVHCQPYQVFSGSSELVSVNTRGSVGH